MLCYIIKIGFPTLCKGNNNINDRCGLLDK